MSLSPIIDIQRRRVNDPIETDEDSAAIMATNQLQIGASKETKAINVNIATARIGTAILSTNFCPRLSDWFDQNGVESTVVNAATPVRAPAIAYFCSAPRTIKIIASESIPPGIRAMRPENEIRIAPGILKSDLYVSST